MAEKKYRFITSSKQFDSDNVGPDYLKEENGVFYAREKKADRWQKIEQLRERTNLSEKTDGLLQFLFIVLYIGTPIVFFVLVDVFLEALGIKTKDGKDNFITVSMLLWFFWLGPFLLVSIFDYIDNKLKKIPCFVRRPNKKIEELIRWNKPYSLSYGSYDSRSKNNYGNSSYGGSSGGSSGGYSGNAGVYLPVADINKALKEFESKGKDITSLINDVTDEEREKLFTKYFKSDDKGQYANDKFNHEIAWPARKKTLEKVLNEKDYEDTETKEMLAEKINNFDGAISNDEFQETAREIKKYQERKRLKDNHVKYEGRLSNKDIKAIKDYRGYICMGCGLDPVEEYGPEMKGILEAHHKKPWAEIKEDEIRTVEPDDFYILCPNCHRMIHRLERPDDLEELKKILNQKQDLSWWD